MDNAVRQLLDEIAAASADSFGENLTGVYVHGSLALGGFTWAGSDVDFIAVTEAAPTGAQKEAYISRLLAMSGHCPPRGFEMSVVLRKYARDFVSPTPYELHLSGMYVERCASDVPRFCREMHGVDCDLAAHFTVIRRSCIVLCGAPASQVFGDVPRECYLRSIKADVENAETEILASPVYIILNLCRVMAYIEEGVVLSKRDGGEWGVAHTGAHAPLIRRALDCYLAAAPFPAESERRELTDFARHMRELIFT